MIKKKTKEFYYFGQYICQKEGRDENMLASHGIVVVMVVVAVAVVVVVVVMLVDIVRIV